jgi:transcriptional regulator with XRE-family HTH domain
MSKVSYALIKARQAAGLSQKQVADALKISPQFMGDIEHGRRELGYRHFGNLPDAIRNSVICAAIDAHQDRIRELKDLLEPKRAKRRVTGANEP